MAILQDTQIESDEVTLSPTMLYDLHSHTTASDGLLSPAELVARAVEMGVTTLAITDHDTTVGLPAARQAIIDLELELELIAGVEISTLWENHEIHIVGLNVDITDPALQTLLAAQVERRQARAKEIALCLEKARIPGALEGATRIAGGAEITRGHFARYLVEQGYATNMGGVFKHYLARGKTGYAPPQWCTIEEAICAIHHAGGLAVVAHPGRYQLSNKWLKRLLVNFKQWGGDAMEVAQCQQAPNERSQLAAYALQFELLASQGSDFHQPCSWIELGRRLWLPTGVAPVWQNW